jgi:hypothetical protein
MIRYSAKGLVGVVFLLSVAACAQATNGTSVAPLNDATMKRSGVSSRAATSTLYVLNLGGGEISIYASGGAKYLRSVQLGGNSIGSFAVDTKGHLFAGLAHFGAGPYVLNIYANRGAKVVQSLSQRQPFAVMTVDSSGNFFETCAERRVCEYPADGKKVVKDHIVRRIQLKNVGGGEIGLLATDSSGDLAVDSLAGIAVYPPHEKVPNWTISNITPSSMAFDSEGNLYVGTGTSGAEVEVFSPGASSPTRTIIDGNGTNANEVALDQADNLYVLTGNCLRSCTEQPAVTVYPAGSSDPSLEVTSGITIGTAHDMTVSPSGELFVSNEDSPGNVSVYASGKTSPERSVEKGISNPIEVRVSR